MEITASLQPLDSTDVGMIRQWRNDYRIWRWCRQNDLISDSEQVKWFNRQSDDPTIKMYKLVVSCEDKDKLKQTPVGVAGFTSIDHFNRRAEFSLYIAPEAHGKGFGKMFLSVLLKHGFSNLGFNVIWGECFEDNPAVKTFEAVGFKKEGTRRQFYFKEGRFWDAHLISMTSEDWNARSHTNLNSVHQHSDAHDPVEATPEQPSRKASVTVLKKTKLKKKSGGHD